MLPRRVLAALAITALSTAFGGCSFAFVDGPPANHRTSAFFGCTSSNGVPMLDTIAATIGLLDAVGFATGSVSDSNSSGARTGNALALGGGAAVLAASAAYGYKRTSECREAQADLSRRTPVFTGGAGPFGPRPSQGPQGPQSPPYDPWVAHPLVAPTTPLAPSAPATGPATDSSPWDGAASSK
jgi:hypothetical protein